MNYIIGLTPLLLIIGFFIIWIYKVVYNHDYIQTYSGNKLKLEKINDFIQKLNAKYKLNIIPIYDTTNNQDYDSKLIFIDQISRFKNKIIGLTFTLTLTFSSLLICLMMCELIDLFDESIRLTFFHITIDFLIFLIVFIQPFLIISLFINGDIYPKNRNPIRIGLTIISLVSWFYILNQFGNLTQSFQPETTSSSSYSRSFIETKINQISITGITLLALLSGIGCSSTPYQLISDYYQLKNTNKHAVTEVVLNHTIQSFNHTNSLLLKRKSELNNLQTVNGTVYNQPSPSYDSSQQLKSLGGTKNKLEGLFNKVQSFANLSNLNLTSNEDQLLKQEIKSLKNLKNSIYLDLTKKIYQFDQNKSSSNNNSSKFNWQKIFKYFQIGFSIYCIYRIINVILFKSRIRSSETNLPSDALAITFAKLITSFVNMPMSEEQLESQLSFVLTGGLFCCSFSNVLTTFNQFSKYLPAAKTSNSIKNWLKHLMISELLGIYVISTAILIRTNLPTTLSQQISKILSLSGTINSTPHTALLEIAFIDKWFDKVFAFTAIITLLLILVKKKIDSESDEYDEELLVETF